MNTSKVQKSAQKISGLEAGQLDLSQLDAEIEKIDGLELEEQLILRQIVLNDNRWSIEVCSAIHEQVERLFESPEAPYSLWMTQEYLAQIALPALKSLEQKGLIEKIPGQSEKIPPDSVCWRIKKPGS